MSNSSKTQLAADHWHGDRDPEGRDRWTWALDQRFTIVCTQRSPLELSVRCDGVQITTRATLWSAMDAANDHAARAIESRRRDALWSALRDLLGAHPRESLDEAAARVMRDALRGRARDAAQVIATSGPLCGEAAWLMLERAALAGRLHVFEADAVWQQGEIVGGGTAEHPSLANVRPIALRPPFNRGNRDAN
jgi:hypothetical protein